jgi:hypothetical protein
MCVYIYIYIYALSHLPCSAKGFGYERNCIRMKLPVTPVPSRESGTNSNYRFSQIRGIQQKETSRPTAFTNRTSRGSSNNGRTAAASVCVCVCMCVCRKAALDVTGLGFIYILLCTRKYGFCSSG